MSGAEHEGSSGGRKGGKTPKPPRASSSLTDAVVAALAKVDGGAKNAKPESVAEAPGAEAGCAATAQQPKSEGNAAPPPAVVAVAPGPPLVVAGAPPPATAGAPTAVPAMVAVAGANGFRSGAGSFSDLIRRWAGGAPMQVVVASPAASAEPAIAGSATAGVAATESRAPSSEPPVVSEPPTADATANAGAEPAAKADGSEPGADQPGAGEPGAKKTSDRPAPEFSVEIASVTATGGPIGVHYFGRTDVGLVREHNEDNFLVADLTEGVRDNDSPRETIVKERGLIFAVCDGMGGAAAGEVASQMAVDTIFEVMDAGGPATDRDSFARRLVSAVEEAGHRIFSAAKMDRSRRGMGTTATLAGLIDNVIFVGEVGDSRAYVLRGDQFEMISKDQSLVNQLIEAGQLTEEEAEGFEHSNIILQALGTTEEVTVDLTFLELRKGDRLLMCSDGLSGLVHSEMMKEVLQGTPDLKEAAGKLTQMANAGGGHDNITIILADFHGEGLAEPGDAKVVYQQYPLPPDDTVRGKSVPPRETSIKSGGKKPGADVKQADGGSAGGDVAVPESGGKGWMIAVGLLLLGALIAGAWFMMKTDETGGEDTTPVRATPEDRTEVIPPVGPELIQEITPPEVVEAAQATVEINTDVEDGSLYVNGELRGPLTDGMTVELPPGPYTFAARSGETRIVEHVVTVTAGETAAVELMVPPGAVEVVAPVVPVVRPPRPPRPEIRTPRTTTGGPVPTNPFL